MLVSEMSANSRNHSSLGRSTTFETASQTTFALIVDYTKSRYDSGVGMHPLSGASLFNGQGYEGFFNIRQNTPSYSISEQKGISLKASHDIGFASLTNIVAYRAVSSFVRSDQDHSSLNIEDLKYNDDRKTFTEELRLQSTSSDRFKWLLGVFFLADVSKLRNFEVGDALAGFTYESLFKQKTHSYAVFGQGTYDITGTLHLTGGLRYTRETLSKDANESFGPSFDSDAGSTKASAFTYKVSLQKDITPDINAYIGYSTGFKSGLYNIADIHADATKPERLSSLEGGVKSELFDRRVRLNVAAFYYWLKDKQIETLVLVDGRLSQVTKNAASTRNYGIKGDLEARVTSDLTIRGGFSWMHSRFQSFENATFSLPVAGGGNVNVPGDASGLMTPHSSDFSGNIGADYNLQTRYGDVTFAANVAYMGTFAWEPDNRLKQRPYTLANGSVTWVAPSKKWDVQIWGKNLFDKKYSIYTAAIIYGDIESPAPPRTFGVKVGFHY